MMNFKTYFLFFAFFTSILFGQNKSERNTQGFYLMLDTQAGLNAVDVFRKKESNAPSASTEKSIFSYGFSSSVGYHFFNFLALNAGLKYNYVTENYHPVYWFVEPRFFVSSNTVGEPTVLSVYLGNKINRTTVDSAILYGISLTKLNATDNGLNSYYGLFLENNQLNYKNNWFVGIKLGVTLFTNKDFN